MGRPAGRVITSTRLDEMSIRGPPFVVLEHQTIISHRTTRPGALVGLDTILGHRPDNPRLGSIPRSINA